jgi:hypothetical protein
MAYSAFLCAAKEREKNQKDKQIGWKVVLFGA